MGIADQSAVSAHIDSGLKKDICIFTQLVGKDVKLKYRRSFLDVLWSVLRALERFESASMMIVMSAVFSTFFVGLRGKNIVNYALYLILGNITFGLMDDATSSPLTSILGSSSLLKKVKIHRTVCPTQKVLFALVNFSFSIKRGETMATHAQPDSSTFQAKQVGDERFTHLPTPGYVVEGQHGHGSFAWQPSTSALRPAFRRCAAA